MVRIMGQVSNADGWKIVVNTNDHEPPHVHVYRGGRTCRVRIGVPAETPPSAYPWAEPRKTTMSAKEVAEAVQRVALQQAAALEKWREIHGHVE